MLPKRKKWKSFSRWIRCMLIKATAHRVEARAGWKKDVLSMWYVADAWKQESNAHPDGRGLGYISNRGPNVTHAVDTSTFRTRRMAQAVIVCKFRPEPRTDGMIHAIDTLIFPGTWNGSSSHCMQINAWTEKDPVCIHQFTGGCIQAGEGMWLEPLQLG